MTTTFSQAAALRIVLGILILVVAPATRAHAQAQTAAESLQSILGPAIDQQHLAGAIVLVTDVNGPVLVEAVGSADLAAQRR